MPILKNVPMQQSGGERSPNHPMLATVRRWGTIKNNIDGTVDVEYEEAQTILTLADLVDKLKERGVI